MFWTELFFECLCLYIVGWLIFSSMLWLIETWRTVVKVLGVSAVLVTLVGLLIWNFEACMGFMILAAAVVSIPVVFSRLTKHYLHRCSIPGCTGPHRSHV